MVISIWLSTPTRRDPKAAPLLLAGCQTLSPSAPGGFAGAPPAWTVPSRVVRPPGRFDCCRLNPPTVEADVSGRVPQAHTVRSGRDARPVPVSRQRARAAQRAVWGPCRRVTRMAWRRGDYHGPNEDVVCPPEEHFRRLCRLAGVLKHGEKDRGRVAQASGGQALLMRRAAVTRATSGLGATTGSHFGPEPNSPTSAPVVRSMSRAAGW